MQQVSEGFVNALSNGGTLVGQVTLLSGGQQVDGFVDLPVESMTLTVARSSAQRSRLSCIIEPTGLVPVDLTDNITPAGNELQASAGWQYADGTQELIPLGIFPISTVTMSTSPPNTVLTIDTYDRSWSIGRRGLTAPYSVGAPVWQADNTYNVGAYVQPTTPNTFMYTCVTGGTSASVEPTWPTSASVFVDGSVTWTFSGSLALPNLGAAIQSLIAMQSVSMPPFTYSITPTPAIAPDVAWNEGTDPWNAANKDLANAAGFELYFDRNGNMVGQPIPDPASAPLSWTYSEGDANGDPVPGTQLIKGITRVLTAEGVSNDFTVSGQATGATIAPRAQAADTSPLSPTFIGGAYGDIPSFPSDPLVTTSQGASSEAQLDLATSFGQIDTLQLDGIPNTAVDVDDVVSVTSTPLNLDDALYVVDGYSTTISAYGTTTLNLRRVLGSAVGGAPVITAVGSPVLQGSDNGIKQIGVNPQALGNIIVMEAVIVNTAPGGIAGVSGGGCSNWTQLATVASQTQDVEFWFGVVTNTGPAKITTTATATGAISFCAQEFTGGPGVVWAQDGVGAAHTGSGSSGNLPAVTPSTAGELYVGGGLTFSGSATGTSSGYVYTPFGWSVGSTNAFLIYNLNVSATASPNWTAASGAYGLASALIRAQLL